MQISAIWIGACIIVGYVCHNTSWCESDLHVHLVIIGRIIVSLSLSDSRPSYYVLFYSCYVCPFSLDTLHPNRYHSLIFISFIPFSSASLGCFRNWNWIIFRWRAHFLRCRYYNGKDIHDWKFIFQLYVNAVHKQKVCNMLDFSFLFFVWNLFGILLQSILIEIYK